MDIQIALPAVLIILVVVLPFYYHHRKQSKKERKMQQILTDAANKYGCNITRKQLFLQSAIGLDEKQHKLLFVHVAEDAPALKVLALDGLIKSAVQIRSAAKQNGSDSPEKVELQLKFNANNSTDETLVFFDKEQANASVSDEVLGARKWADYLSLTYTSNS